jgi:hypothetical protein
MSLVWDCPGVQGLRKRFDRRGRGLGQAQFVTRCQDECRAYRQIQSRIEP